MAIIASADSGSTFTPHPDGPFAAVCCDVDDLGMVEVTWQGETKQQHKVDLWWFCGEFRDGDPQGQPLLVRRRFTLSLAETSNLRPFLEHWRGKKFTAEELRGFDLEKLIGAPCFLQVSHNERGDKVYANVDAIMKLPPNQTAPAIPSDLKRPSVSRRERAAAEQETRGQAAAPSGRSHHDDVPPRPEDPYDGAYGVSDDELPF